MAAKPKPNKLGVTWSKATRKRVHGSLDPLPIDPKPTSVAAAWKKLHERYARALVDPRPPADGDPALEATLDELRAELRRPEPPAPGDPERERLRGELLLEEAVGPGGWAPQRREVLGDLLVLWSGTRGLAFATQMVIAPFSIECHATIASSAKREERRLVARREPAAHSDLLSRSMIEVDLLLRRLALAAPRDEYEAALAIARPTEPGRRTLLNAFCRDPSPAHRLAATSTPVEPDARPAPKHPNAEYFISGILDPDLAMLVARATPLNHATALGPHALDVVDNLGTKAAPVLVELLRRVSSGTEARKALAAAAVLADPAHAKRLLPSLSGPAKTALGAALVAAK